MITGLIRKFRSASHSNRKNTLSASFPIDLARENLTHQRSVKRLVKQFKPPLPELRCWARNLSHGLGQNGFSR